NKYLIKMAKKRGSPKGIQGLAIFDHKEGPRKKETDRYTVEKINKTDKVKIINSLTAQGIHYRYSILLNNETSASITDINVKVFFPVFLKFSGSYPLTFIASFPIVDKQDTTNNINLNLKELKGKSSEQIFLHFTPSTRIGRGELKTFLKYTKNKGKKREINSDSITIQIDEMIITPKIITHSRIRDFSRIPDMKKAIISLGIGTSKKLNSQKIFDVFENLIQSYNFQFITKEREKGFLWFFGSESKTNNDILVISKLGLNVIEIMAQSINPVLLNLFLSSINRKLREQLSIHKIIKSKIKIFDLECINCHAHLPYFPKKSETITCSICSYKQIVW
ncbi:MAG: hypothetical protein ACXAAH_06345, partial [Promethearchaeota archaeon]